MGVEVKGLSIWRSMWLKDRDMKRSERGTWGSHVEIERERDLGVLYINGVA